MVPQLYEGKSNSTGTDHLGKLRNPGEIAVEIFISDFHVSTEANDSYNRIPLFCNQKVQDASIHKHIHHPTSQLVACLPKKKSFHMPRKKKLWEKTYFKYCKGLHLKSLLASLAIRTNIEQ
jgi:hypothetical protein